MFKTFKELNMLKQILEALIPNFNQYSKFLEELEKTTDIRWGSIHKHPKTFKRIEDV